MSECCNSTRLTLLTRPYNDILPFLLFFSVEGKLSVIREKKELSGSSTSLNSIGKRKKAYV